VFVCPCAGRGYIVDAGDDDSARCDAYATGTIPDPLVDDGSPYDNPREVVESVGALGSDCALCKDDMFDTLDVFSIVGLFDILLRVV